MKITTLLRGVISPKTGSAQTAKNRLALIVSDKRGHDHIARDLENRIKKLVHDFFIEKGVPDDQIELLRYEISNDGEMEITIPIPDKN